MAASAALEAVAKLAERLLERHRGLAVLGIAGTQGSGKSTVALGIEARMATHGVRCAVLSIDDLYLPLAARERLAAEVHPLLRTRGVPGTHDVPLGLAVIDALAQGQPVPLPRFDKARDDRVPEAQWPRAPEATRLLILEGWCVGARPQAEACLDVPINALEAQEDADGRWRRHVNAALAGDYQTLFARIDALAFLAAPDFAVVERWRGEQEAALRRQSGDEAGVMDEAQLSRFIQHYERITRAMLTEPPTRATLTVRLREDRSVAGVE
ncbi:kinase [Sphingobium sp. CCH11-B1]|uniref:kinase n=1 Tax=Sphingobium sp. CCH11-B1 TaxID=1768781 RepID=UPI0008332E9F|nr:kinase [Sphingobium sp. CCH11-B1]MEA3387845.1 kinase [Pseudomonadota bacterium]